MGKALSSMLKPIPSLWGKAAPILVQFVERYLFSGPPRVRPWRLREKLPVFHAPEKK
jgi:hypothetical protein